MDNFTSIRKEIRKICLLLGTIGITIHALKYSAENWNFSLFLLIDTAVFAASLYMLVRYFINPHIKSLLSVNAHLCKELSKNTPLIQIGKHSATITHNVKSTLSAIENGVYTLIQYTEGFDLPSEQKKQIFDILLRMREAASSSSRSMEQLLYAVTLKTKRTRAWVDIRKIIEGIVEEIRLDRRILTSVQFNLEFLDELYYYGYGYGITSVIENVIRNAVESILHHVRFGAVVITTWKEGGISFVSVFDDGGGIEFCPSTCTGNCLDCSNFYFGKTTKRNGNGIGMYSVRKWLRENNGKFKVINRYGEGVTIIIGLPGRDHIESFRKIPYNTLSNETGR